jgi:hypothetical protein
MEKLSAQELILLIEENVEPEDFAFGDYNYTELSKILGEFNFVDEMEDADSVCYTVWYFRNHNVYIKLSGKLSQLGFYDYSDYKYNEVVSVEEHFMVWQDIN